MKAKRNEDNYNQKAVRDALEKAGLSKHLTDEHKIEGDKTMNESYKDKFNAAMKKFGINSLDDLETDADKKKFFKHVDSTHTADHEEAYLPPVKYPVAKRSKTRTGLSNQVELEGGPGSGPQFKSATIKKAYGILNDPRYKGGNYSGAAKAIEKLAKGLSDHPDVKNAMKRANESKETKEMKQESKKYHKTKPGSLQDSVMQMQVNEQKDVTIRVKELSALIETYLAKGGVSHNLSPVIAEKELSGVLPLQAVREFIGTYNRHFLTNYKAEEFVLDEGIFSKKIQYAYYQFKNKNEANRAARTAEAVFNSVDYEIEVSSGGAGQNLTVDGGKKDITKIHKELLRLYRPKVLETEKKEG
jgi:hypothetical protein